MTIDFNEIELSVLPNFKGGEKEFAANMFFDGTILEMGPESDTQTRRGVKAGDCLYCPKGHTHSLMNTSEEGDLVFYAVVPKQ